jgi:hypothetical protein
MRVRILPALLVVLPALAQSPAPDLRGIYIYTNDVSQITGATSALLTKSFNIPGVDGVAVVIGWDAIEPSMGQYSFALHDLHIVYPADLSNQIPHSGRRVSYQHRLPVFGRPYQVQVDFVYCVRAASVFCHSSSLLGGAAS